MTEEGAPAPSSVLDEQTRAHIEKAFFNRACRQHSQREPPTPPGHADSDGPDVG
jgi:hypothetical protein